MKLPIPLLLYVSSVGLVGLAGWTVYKMVPLLSKETREAATGKGMKDATDRMSLGRNSQGGSSADWAYNKRTAPWWDEFKAVNFIGKLPPPPPPPPGTAAATPLQVPKDVRPLDQIIELVSIVYDSKDKGQGELSHVIVRYKPEADVQPPEWYMRETATGPASSGPVAMARGDVAPVPRTGGNPSGPGGRPPAAGQDPRRGGGNKPASALPTSTIGREVLQKVWIHGDGDPRRDAHLWGKFADIKLVRVDESAQCAYFVRVPPPPADGQPPAEAPKEEILVKTAVGIDQEVLRELHRISGTPLPSRAGGGANAASPAASSGTWQECEETTQVGNVRHIGRKQEQRFRENPDELWEKIHVDTFVSKSSSTRGLQVRNVDPQVASQFGLSQGDVLLEVNGHPVQTQAQAVQFGKGEYKKGVRTFVTKWMSAGQVVERTYQASDR